jgi:hypothetical protein
LKPPIPSNKNRALQHFAKPRVFDDSSEDFVLRSIERNHFDGWSFVIPQGKDDKPNSNI